MNNFSPMVLFGQLKKKCIEVQKANRKALPSPLRKASRICGLFFCIKLYIARQKILKEVLWAAVGYILMTNQQIP